MKTNKIMNDIRQTTPPETKMQVDFAVAISNCIYDILEERGMSVKDLAKLMNKNESEVNLWLSGTYNLRLSDLSYISNVLNEDVIKVCSRNKEMASA